MGATKRVGGSYCRALDVEARPGAPRCIVVRLGNVLGSTGTVAPLVERQLGEGAALTVTHREARRYFITVPQAAESLLQAALVGLDKAALRGAVYVPEMGEDIPIVDLAQDIALLAGKRPGVDAIIEFTGLRPGEKLREDLVAEGETAQATSSGAVVAVTSPLASLASVEARLEHIVRLARTGDSAGVRAALKAATAPAGYDAGEDVREAS